MRKSPSYQIRTRHTNEEPRPMAPSPVVPRPKIKLNMSPVAIVPAEDIGTEPETASTIPDITADDIRTIHFPHSYTSKTKRKKRTAPFLRPPRHFARLSAVAGGAVAVGLLLGYVVLQTFTGENPQPGTTTPSVQTVPSGTSVQQGKLVSPPPAQPAAPKTKPITVVLPVVPLYVVQGGIFSTKEGAQQEIAAFQQKGWPVHMTEEGGKHALFLGVSASRDDALALAGTYRASKQDVYIKEKNLPAKTMTLSVPDTLSADTVKEIEQFGKNQVALFQTVSSLMGTGLKEGKISQAAVEKMTAQHREVLQQGRSLTTVLEEKQKATLQNALNEMTTAVTTLQQFAGQPNRTYVWQAEGSILRFISLYKGWQEMMNG
jgi:hypothetical protein